MPFGLNRRAGEAVVELHGVIGTRIRTSTYSRLCDGIARNKRHTALSLDFASAVPQLLLSGGPKLHRLFLTFLQQPLFPLVRFVQDRRCRLPGCEYSPLGQYVWN